MIVLVTGIYDRILMNFTDLVRHYAVLEILLLGIPRILMPLPAKFLVRVHKNLL